MKTTFTQVKTAFTKDDNEFIRRRRAAELKKEAAVVQEFELHNQTQENQPMITDP